MRRRYLVLHARKDTRTKPTDANNKPTLIMDIRQLLHSLCTVGNQQTLPVPIYSGRIIREGLALVQTSQGVNVRY